MILVIGKVAMADIGTLYYLSNFSVNLELFKSKKFLKVSYLVVFFLMLQITSLVDLIFVQKRRSLLPNCVVIE